MTEPGRWTHDIACMRAHKEVSKKKKKVPRRVAKHLDGSWMDLSFDV